MIFFIQPFFFFFRNERNFIFCIFSYYSHPLFVSKVETKKGKCHAVNLTNPHHLLHLKAFSWCPSKCSSSSRMRIVLFISSITATTGRGQSVLAIKHSCVLNTTMKEKKSPWKKKTSQGERREKRFPFQGKQRYFTLI